MTATTQEKLAAHGADTIAKGSKSFALASLLFGREMQADVHMLYAWCRHCDDVIDGQDLGGDAPDQLSPKEMSRRLDELRANTTAALAGERTGVPAFDGFSIVARKHDLPAQYPMDLLAGFASDAAQRQFHSIDDLMEYCYGVAGVVGVMMAITMGVRKDDHETLDRACDLGLAFQLTNICRDVLDDAKGGRIYLPLDLLAEEGVAPEPAALLLPDNRASVARVVAVLIHTADQYYVSASVGARRLPLRAAAAVLAARNVYRDIGNKVLRHGAHAWDRRTVIPASRKFLLAVAGAGAGCVQSMTRRSKPLGDRGSLWERSQMARRGIMKP